MTSSTERPGHPTAIRPRRTLEAGAVYVEALIVGLLLILLFSGALYLYSLYSAKLETVVRARQAAWTSTHAGCGGRFWFDVEALVKSMARRDAHFTGNVVSGDSFGSTFAEWWRDEQGFLVELLGSEDVVEETQVVERPHAVGTTTLMGCNEHPHDLGTRRNSFEWLFELFGPES